VQPAIGILRLRDKGDREGGDFTVDVRARLTPDEYADCLAAIRRISSFHATIDLFSLVPANFTDFRVSIEQALDAWREPTKRPALAATIGVEVNRRVLNFLCSARTYLDHTETTLKRTYGERSLVATRFREATSAAYDGDFAYRFAYRLRNFAQHCGLPASYIRFQTLPPEQPGTPNQYSVHVGAWRDHLLAEFDWGPLTSEIAAQPQIIDLPPVLHSFMRSLESIQSEVAEAELPLLRPIAEAIAAWRDRIAPIDGEVYILNLEGPEDAAGAVDLTRVRGIGFTPFPLHVAEEILRGGVTHSLSLSDDVIGS
jgi:hypothetical protein